MKMIVKHQRIHLRQKSFLRKMIVEQCLFFLQKNQKITFLQSMFQWSINVCLYTSTNKSLMFQYSQFGEIIRPPLKHCILQGFPRNQKYCKNDHFPYWFSGYIYGFEELQFVSSWVFIFLTGFPYSIFLKSTVISSLFIKSCKVLQIRPNKWTGQVFE